MAYVHNGTVLMLVGLATIAIALQASPERGKSIETEPQESAKKGLSVVPVISEIHFQGNGWISAEKIAGEISTHIGQPLDERTIKADVDELMKTMWFCDVSAHFPRARSDADIAF